jgi:hypothetical protein
VNCANCAKCANFVNCANCENCVNCVNCLNCVNCVNCANRVNCFNCVNSLKADTSHENNKILHFSAISFFSFGRRPLFHRLHNIEVLLSIQFSIFYKCLMNLCN